MINLFDQSRMKYSEDLFRSSLIEIQINFVAEITKSIMT